MARSSSEHAVFLLIYMNYKSFIAVETYEILMATQNRICFEILMQEFDTLFGYIFPEGPKLNLLNIRIIQIKYVISIDQGYNIIKNIIQEYWLTKTKDEVKFQRSHFPVGKSFGKLLSVATPLVGE